MLEARLETYFYRRVKRDLSGIVVKLAPTVVGVPDRLVVLSDGRIYLVELKTLAGRLSPAQQAWHAKAAALGAPVVVLYGRFGIEKWVDERLAEVAPI